MDIPSYIFFTHLDLSVLLVYVNVRVLVYIGILVGPERTVSVPNFASMLTFSHNSGELLAMLVLIEFWGKGNLPDYLP